MLRWGIAPIKAPLRPVDCLALWRCGHVPRRPHWLQLARRGSEDACRPPPPRVRRAGGSCGAPAPRRRSFAATGEGAMRTEYTFDELLAEHDVEIVHDIDLKDGKFGRPEAAGIDRLIAGIAMGHRDDESRLERGSAVFDDLYAYFSRRRG